MKKKRIIALFFYIGLGLFIIWFAIRSFDNEEINQMKEVFYETNYFWFLASVLLAIFSHVLRAIRWNYILEPLGFKTSFFNRLLTVLINHVINLVIPRMGEVSRCMYLSKYENIPFDKTFGTLISERILDLLILFLIAMGVVIYEYNRLYNFLYYILRRFMLKDKLLLFLFTIVIVIGTILFFVLSSSKNIVVIKIKKILHGIKEGILSIRDIKDMKTFIFQTIMIWVVYISMFYICFFSLEQTQNVSFLGILAAFVLGGISMIVTQGGLGAYPLAIGQILVLYNIQYSVGYAFGTLVWGIQTLMVIVLGGLSLIIIPIYNKYRVED